MDTKPETIWNVPNKISAARLLLSFVVFALIPIGWYWSALVAFVIAASTDWVDGWWARKYQQVSQLGRILDPFCDKILICGVFILLAEAMVGFPWYARISGWVAVIVVARELLVTALRGLIEQSGGDFSAKMAGKLKMVLQCLAAGACLAALALNPMAHFEALPPWLKASMVASIWLAVLTTIYSGAEYVAAAAKFFLPNRR